MILNCDYCGKEFSKIPSQLKKVNFCCKECWYKWKSENIRGKNCSFYKEKVKHNCSNCDKEILVFPSEYKYLQEGKLKNLFCSKECKQEWESKNWTKENNPNYSGGRYQKCLYCNNDYYVLPYRQETSKFCCRECKDKWMAENLKNDEEYVAFHRKIGTQTMQNHNNKFTKPERFVAKFLDDNNIEYIPQYSMYDRFVVDFYLPKTDLVIEVLGDYWHGHPDKYGNDINKKPLTDIQIKNKSKDIIKQNFLEDKGHIVKMIWECDIYKDINSVLSFLL
jgi:G:T-mismatch repair DNA endonuclease (very short patch repair protein)